jgi:hypothetical protein
LVDVTVAFEVAREMAKNVAMAIPAVRDKRLARHRTALPSDGSHLDRYAFPLLDLAMTYLGSVNGKTILEIGPGDHLASGLAFLAAGAKSYAAVDRFPGAYSSELSRRWYHLVAQTWSHKYPQLKWPAHLDPSRFPDYPEVTTFPVSAENFKQTLRYDLVCSFAVGEHVSDINAFAALNRRAVSTSGVGLHVIDFGGHQWDRPHDPYLFLRFPESIWRAMGSNRGFPNRGRFHEYLAAFSQSGLSVEVVDRKAFKTSGRRPPSWVMRLPEESISVQEATFIVRPL